MSPALKTSSQKTNSRFIWGRYILIVGAALILATLLYTLLDVSDKDEGLEIEVLTISDSTDGAIIGVQPASFQQINEFRDGTFQRLRLAGNAEAGAVVVITNLGERLRQVPVNDQGQWGVTLEVEDKPMALEAQLYVDEDSLGVRSEETVFRVPIPDAAPDTKADNDADTQSPAAYKTSALIMVTAPGRASRLIQSPYGGVPTAGPLSLSTIDYDYTGGVIITGTSTVPGRVRIYAQDAVIGDIGIGVGGRWIFIAGRILPRAMVNIRVELIPAQGTPNAPREPISISVPFNFLAPLQEEDTDGSGALFVNIDPQQWQIRRTLIGGGGQSTVIFAPDVTTAKVPVREIPKPRIPEPKIKQ